jgi:hypothetical protein
MCARLSLAKEILLSCEKLAWQHRGGAVHPHPAGLGNELAVVCRAKTLSVRRATAAATVMMSRREANGSIDVDSETDLSIIFFSSGKAWEGEGYPSLPSMRRGRRALWP